MKIKSIKTLTQYSPGEDRNEMAVIIEFENGGAKQAVLAADLDGKFDIADVAAMFRRLARAIENDG